MDIIQEAIMIKFITSFNVFATEDIVMLSLSDTQPNLETITFTVSSSYDD